MAPRKDSPRKARVVSAVLPVPASAAAERVSVVRTGAGRVRPAAPAADSRSRQVVDRLLDAATALFMEKGYDVTSMGEISARAHASKETIYRHFPAKEDLFRAVVVRHAETVARDLTTGLLEHEAPERALTVFGEHILAHMMTQKSLGFHRVLGMARDRFPELLQLYRSTGPQRVRDAVAQYLSDQVGLGRLRTMEPQVASRQFFDLVASEMIISANISGKANPSKAFMRQRVKEGVDCFLHGYTPSAGAGTTPAR